jgi:hypothetical protein
MCPPPISCMVFALCTSACVLTENAGDEVAPGCGELHGSQDGEACHCTSDCRTEESGTSCLDEWNTGMPRGICYHTCQSDAECEAGFICTAGACFARCNRTADCRPGRACLSRLEDDAGACLFQCDADADCESGNCSRYSGMCLRTGQQAQGKGLSQPCSADHECASGACDRQVCITGCDVEFQRCPESATCTMLPDSTAECLFPCQSEAECSSLGSRTCQQLSNGDFCYP